MEFKCKKCGSLDIVPRFQVEYDNLHCTCRRCDFTWYQEPAEKEPVQVVLESAPESAPVEEKRSLLRKKR